MLVEALISWHLDYYNSLSRYIWWTDDPAAVCPECCCTSRVGRSTVRPHHAGATSAALASG